MALDGDVGVSTVAAGGGGSGARVGDVGAVAADADVSNESFDGCVGVVTADVELRSGDETDTGESGFGRGRRKGDERGVPMPRGDGLYDDAVADADIVLDIRRRRHRIEILGTDIVFRRDDATTTTNVSVVRGHTCRWRRMSSAVETRQGPRVGSEVVSGARCFAQSAEMLQIAVLDLCVAAVRLNFSEMQRCRCWMDRQCR
jgi:hypothetical protein